MVLIGGGNYEVKNVFFHLVCAHKLEKVARYWSCRDNILFILFYFEIIFERKRKNIQFFKIKTKKQEGMKAHKHTMFLLEN